MDLFTDEFSELNFKELKDLMSSHGISYSHPTKNKFTKAEMQAALRAFEAPVEADEFSELSRKELKDLMTSHGISYSRQIGGRQKFFTKAEMLAALRASEVVDEFSGLNNKELKDLMISHGISYYHDRKASGKRDKFTKAEMQAALRAFKARVEAGEEARPKPPSGAKSTVRRPGRQAQEERNAQAVDDEFSKLNIKELRDLMTSYGISYHQKGEVHKFTKAEMQAALRAFEARVEAGEEARPEATAKVAKASCDDTVSDLIDRTTCGFLLNSDFHLPTDNNTQRQASRPYTRMHVFARKTHMGFKRQTLVVYDPTQAPQRNNKTLQRALKASTGEDAVIREFGDTDSEDDELLPSEVGSTRAAGVASVQATTDAQKWSRSAPASTKAELEDMLTKFNLLSHEDDTQQSTTASNRLHNVEEIFFQGQRYPVRRRTGPQNNKVRSVSIGIARTSSAISSAQVDSLHITNCMIFNDFRQVYQRTRQQSPNNTALINLDEQYESLVFVDKPAWAPFSVYHAAHHTLPESRFVELLEQAHRESREVLLLVRGISGFSVWPNVYARIYQRWPNMVVRVVYAVQESFLRKACLDTQQERQVPIFFSPLQQSELGLRYSEVINTRIRVDQHLGATNAVSQQLLDWDGEEVAARTRGLPLAICTFITISRGRGRHKIKFLR